MISALTTVIGPHTIDDFLWPWGVTLVVAVACAALLLSGGGQRLPRFARIPGLAAAAVVGLGALAVMGAYVVDGRSLRLW